ncbi:PEP-CTERM sorting domain-containing protein [Paucibacter sp. KBW04]|uniref:choice-of-anchor J family PEP-CTERM protein n=1 Tax=Paucibacter sp. KBW04 TaxID=2153361 RepID=UPI000F5695CE|nr:choice-of-anchor J domain-containing protein [Paucibacter sp. KBW04]RQO55899.1 PEP-CTERM sorting domain-containing protein [Paucibacter sp. KBW04]
MFASKTIARFAVPALLGSLALAGTASAASMTEGFDSMTPAGWTVKNNSVPLGSTSWFQGTTSVFTSQAGAANSYAGVNYNSTAGAGDISNWLITPTMSFNNGDVVSFYTRTASGSIWPDALELRFSATGGTNVGSTATSVGSFTNLLVSINPALDAGGYPEDWTMYTATISGLSGTTNGALAFRYVVADGGPSGNNSNYIGIDTFSITAAVPEPGTYALMGLGLLGLGLRARSNSRKTK